MLLCELRYFLPPDFAPPEADFFAPPEDRELPLAAEPLLLVPPVDLLAPDERELPLFEPDDLLPPLFEPEDLLALLFDEPLLAPPVFDPLLLEALLFFAPPVFELLLFELLLFEPPDAFLAPPFPDEEDELLFDPPLFFAPPDDLLPTVASTADVAAPTTAPDAAPLSISPTTTVALSTNFATVPFRFAICPFLLLRVSNVRVSNVGMLAFSNARVCIAEHIHRAQARARKRSLLGATRVTYLFPVRARLSKIWIDREELVALIDKARDSGALVRVLDDRKHSFQIRLQNTRTYPLLFKSGTDLAFERVLFPFAGHVDRALSQKSLSTVIVSLRNRGARTTIEGIESRRQQARASVAGFARSLAR